MLRHSYLLIATGLAFAGAASAQSPQAVGKISFRRTVLDTVFRSVLGRFRGVPFELHGASLMILRAPKGLVTDD